MKISEKYESFDEEKVKNIVKELIKSGIFFSVGIEPALYQKIQRVATKLGYMDIKRRDLRRSGGVRRPVYTVPIRSARGSTSECAIRQTWPPNWRD